MTEFLTAIGVLTTIIFGSFLLVRIIFGKIDRSETDFDRYWWDLNH